MDLQRALEIAETKEWSGDVRVNLRTAHKAAARLAHHIAMLHETQEALEKQVRKLRRELKDLEEDKPDGTNGYSPGHWSV